MEQATNYLPYINTALLALITLSLMSLVGNFYNYINTPKNTIDYCNKLLFRISLLIYLSKRKSINGHIVRVSKYAEQYVFFLKKNDVDRLGSLFAELLKEEEKQLQILEEVVNLLQLQISNYKDK